MKSERFEMRLDREIVQQVDEWRTEQLDRPSRAEAVRRLVGTGLAVLRQSDNRMSAGEVLILMMMRDLYKHLGAKGEIDPDFVAQTIWGGHFWGLSWEYSGLFHGHVDKRQTVDEVLDLMEMWHFIESGYDNLSKQERQNLESDVGPRGKDVRFPGFDGNNESEQLGIAKFLVERLDRFQRFKGRDLNSHFPSIDTYRRMWPVFEPMRTTLAGGELTYRRLVQILKA